MATIFDPVTGCSSTGFEATDVFYALKSKHLPPTGAIVGGEIRPFQKLKLKFCAKLTIYSKFCFAYFRVLLSPFGG